MTTEDVIPMDRLAKIYIKIRGAKAALQQELETKIEELEAQQKEVANRMKDQMLAMGAGTKSLKTEFGTIILSEKTKYWASDWESMGNFIVQNNAPHLLEKRIAQKAMADFLVENPGLVPAGLNSETEVTVTVRKPT